ncbi:MAG: hypothetical protein D6730_14890 [Bacteroidetes bacterium]|nr:MAG: hypothetical protein D6730_14890 [Bacteroidota bacterium]
MNTFYALLIACLFVLPLYAQVPGYTGKRQLLVADIHLFPAIRFSKLKDGMLPVNLRLGLSHEYVLSRRFSASFTASYIQSGFDYERNGGQISGKGRISGYALGLGFRMYSFRRVGNIAPLGPFQQLELLYLGHGMRDTDRLFYPDGRRKLARFRDMGLVFTLGNQRIIHPRISYKLAVQVGTVLGLFDHRGTQDEQYLKEVATDRLQGYFFLNFHAGIGVLLF